MDLFIEQIKNDIQALNKRNKIVYCLLISEKLLPNYKYFCNIYKFGEIKKLEQIIDILYDYVFDKINVSHEEINIYLNEIEEITPDTNDYSTILVSFALDACTAIISTLNFIKSENDNHVLDVASYARDTVDMFIQERDDLDLNNRELETLIENDNLMKKEKEKQKRIIEYLKKHDIINKMFIEELREINSGNIININIFKN